MDIRLSSIIFRRLLLWTNTAQEIMESTTQKLKYCVNRNKTQFVETTVLKLLVMFSKFKLIRSQIYYYPTPLIFLFSFFTCILTFKISCSPVLFSCPVIFCKHLFSFSLKNYIDDIKEKI